MKLGEAERLLTEELSTIYDESESANIARLVLEDCTGLPPAQLVLNRTLELLPSQQETLNHHLQRLLQHEPLQYVLQKAWFYGMELYVDKAVLIPRPETEELVDWVVKDTRVAGKDVFEKSASQSDQTTQLKILDVGTGSGCIALALKKELPRAEIWGCDVSDEALNVARRNGATLDIRVDFHGINFLDDSQQISLPTVDVIVSNPPYIARREAEHMRLNVLNYEPQIALFVPDNDPLVFYRAIAKFAHRRLYDGGDIYLELNETLAEETKALFEAEGFADAMVRKDMQGKSRMLRVRR